MGIINAIRFLTILPIPIKREITERDLGRSAAWFPAAGALIGALLFLIFYGFSQFLSSFAVNAFVLVFWVFITRGFHLDGLADTVDGIGGGITRGKKLIIMKDSRIGVFGVLALFCVLLLKLVLLSELNTQFHFQALVLAPVLGRWAMVLSMFSFPSAREGGMGQCFKKHCRIIEIIIASITAIICAYFLFDFWGIAILIVQGALAAGLSAFFTHSLGGLTGDTYGAVCEIGEVFTLLGIIIFVPY